MTEIYSNSFYYDDDSYFPSRVKTWSELNAFGIIRHNKSTGVLVTKDNNIWDFDPEFKLYLLRD